MNPNLPKRAPRGTLPDSSGTRAWLARFGLLCLPALLAPVTAAMSADGPAFVEDSRLVAASGSTASGAGNDVVTGAPPQVADRAAAAARRAASVLEQRIEEIQPEPEPRARAKRVRAALAETRELLVTSGIEDNLAAALAAATSEWSISPGEDGEDAKPLRPRSVQALRIVRKRLLAFAEASERPAKAAPREARSRLEAILRDPVFKAQASTGAGPLQRWLTKLRQSLLDALLVFSEVVSQHIQIVGVLIVIFTILALTLVVVRIAPLFGRHSSRPAPHDSAPVRERDARETAAGVLHRAKAEAAAGRLSPAMRLLEKAAILALRSSGELPERPGLTDLEGIQLLRDRGAAARRSVFERLAELHDRSIYARRELGAGTVSEATALAESIVGAGKKRPA